MRASGCSEVHLKLLLRRRRMPIHGLSALWVPVGAKCVAPVQNLVRVTLALGFAGPVILFPLKETHLSCNFARVRLPYTWKMELQSHMCKFLAMQGKIIEGLSLISLQCDRNLTPCALDAHRWWGRTPCGSWEPSCGWRG